MGVTGEYSKPSTAAPSGIDTDGVAPSKPEFIDYDEVQASDDMGTLDEKNKGLIAIIMMALSVRIACITNSTAHQPLTCPSINAARGIPRRHRHHNCNNRTPRHCRTLPIRGRLHVDWICISARLCCIDTPLGQTR